MHSWATRHARAAGHGQGSLSSGPSPAASLGGSRGRGGLTKGLPRAAAAWAGTSREDESWPAPASRSWAASTAKEDCTGSFEGRGRREWGRSGALTQACQRKAGLGCGLRALQGSFVRRHRAGLGLGRDGGQLGLELERRLGCRANFNPILSYTSTGLAGLGQGQGGMDALTG